MARCETLTVRGDRDKTVDNLSRSILPRSWPLTLWFPMSTEMWDATGCDVTDSGWIRFVEDRERSWCPTGGLCRMKALGVGSRGAPSVYVARMPLRLPCSTSRDRSDRHGGSIRRAARVGRHDLTATGRSVGARALGEGSVHRRFGSNGHAALAGQPVSEARGLGKMVERRVLALTAPATDSGRSALADDE